MRFVVFFFIGGIQSNVPWNPVIMSSLVFKRQMANIGVLVIHDSPNGVCRGFKLACLAVLSNGFSLLFYWQDKNLEAHILLTTNCTFPHIQGYAT